jgi:drug/metabolite transporter (DMT)-like permease
VTTLVDRDQRTSLVPAAAMVTVILAWGLGPPISKLISAPPLVTVTYRFWLSVILLYGILLLRGERPTLSHLKLAAPAGIAFGVNLSFVFFSFDHAAIAVLSVMAALQPGLILLVAGPLFGERVTQWHVAWMVVAVGGTAIVILGAGAEVETDALGVLFTFIVLVTFTVFFLLSKVARQRTPVSPMEWMAGVSLFAALTVTPLCLITSDAEDYRELAGADWLWLAFIVLITGLLGHVLMSWLHSYIDVSRSSIYLLAMNIVAVGAAWPIHDEPITLVQGLGGLVVLAGVAAIVSRPAVPVAGRLAPPT